MSPISATPFRDLVDHSFDEAAFLWGRWERELSSLTRNLDEVWSWTEDRLHGALDGVRVAGGDMIDLAAEGLRSADAERVSVSAGLLASSADARATEAVTSALSAAEGERLTAMLRGLELLGTPQALRSAATLLSSGGPIGAGALCRLKAFHRSLPGDELLTASRSTNHEAKISAVRAAIHAGVAQGEQFITAAMEDDDPLLRAAAVESGVTRGMPRAWKSAVDAARPLGGEAAPYLKLLAMRGTADDHETVFAALRVPALQAPAIWALGHIGTARAVDACLAGMQYTHLARAAGEAYCWITGANLERDRLAALEIPPDAPTFEDDDLDANLVPPPEASWPLPDREAVRRDWTKRQSSVTPDVRYIQGQPATTQAMMAMAESGPMLRRPDLVFELRFKTHGKYDVEPFAFSARQRRMMAAARVAVLNQGER